MKGKSFLLGFILLNILILSTMVQVQAASYSLGIKKDTEITLEVKAFDKKGLKKVFGDGWENAIPEGADEIGMKYKIIVKEVDKDTKIDLGIYGDYDAFSITVNIWEWTSDEFGEKPDDEEFEIVWFQEPEDLNDAFDVNRGFGDKMPFVPISVAKFLDDVDWKKQWEARDNMIIHDSIMDEEENFVEMCIYDTETGYLTGYKIVNEDGDVIYEYGLSQFIPGYEIPLILGITGIFIIGLIYIIKKKTKI